MPVTCRPHTTFRRRYYRHPQCSPISSLVSQRPLIANMLRHCQLSVASHSSHSKRCNKVTRVAVFIRNDSRRQTVKCREIKNLNVVVHNTSASLTHVLEELLRYRRRSFPQTRTGVAINCALTLSVIAYEPHITNPVFVDCATTHITHLARVFLYGLQFKNSSERLEDISDI